MNELRNCCPNGGSLHRHDEVAHPVIIVHHSHHGPHPELNIQGQLRYHSMRNQKGMAAPSSEYSHDHYHCLPTLVGLPQAAPLLKKEAFANDTSVNRRVRQWQYIRKYMKMNDKRDDACLRLPVRTTSPCANGTMLLMSASRW